MILTIVKKIKIINESLPGTIGFNKFIDEDDECKNSFYGLIDNNKVIYFGEDKGIKGIKGEKGQKGIKGQKGEYGDNGIIGNKGEEGFDPNIIYNGNLTNKKMNILYDREEYGPYLLSDSNYNLIKFIENNYYPFYKEVKYILKNYFIMEYLMENLI